VIKLRRNVVNLLNYLIIIISWYFRSPIKRSKFLLTSKETSAESRTPCFAIRALFSPAQNAVNELSKCMCSYRIVSISLDSNRLSKHEFAPMCLQNNNKRGALLQRATPAPKWLAQSPLSHCLLFKTLSAHSRSLFFMEILIKHWLTESSKYKTLHLHTVAVAQRRLISSIGRERVCWAASARHSQPTPTHLLNKYLLWRASWSIKKWVGSALQRRSIAG